MSEFLFLISFTSNDSKRIYPENSGRDFYFRLDKRLKTDQGRWTVTLFNFHNSEINPQNDTAIICMDGVTQSVVGDNMWLPCLDRYPKGNSVTHPPVSFKVTRDYFETLHIYLHGEESSLNRYSKHISTIQLLFQQERCE